MRVDSEMWRSAREYKIKRKAEEESGVNYNDCIACSYI